MDYDSLQVFLNKRRGDVRYQISYTLGKAEGFGSGNGDDPLNDEGWRPSDNFRIVIVGNSQGDENALTSAVAERAGRGTR